MKFILYTIQYFCMVLVTFMVMFTCARIPVLVDRAVIGALITGAIFAFCHCLIDGIHAENVRRVAAMKKQLQVRQIRALTRGREKE